MNRFVAPDLTLSSREIVLKDSEEVHHAFHVLRVREGDTAEFVSGNGVLAEGRIVSVGKSRLTAEVVHCAVVEKPGSPSIILACALPKRAKFEMILEKAVELGVDGVVPLITARTEARGAEGGGKDGRYARVLLNACKQSKRVWFPELYPVMSMEAAVKKFCVPGAAAFIPWLEGERQHIRDTMPARPPASIVFFIGPEGDFTAEEIELAKQCGVKPVSLGNTTLKVDTAAIAVVSFARFFF
ncbi:MAG: 16S rRNA (uracil(1498)-N(3))-methyltransferase [Candidatus Omnitrophica bacterium]|nr:16S rRNA (uracil(1498)-N(3))-methyltransferase [Candidatus Omnitrophota bacterium]